MLATAINAFLPHRKNAKVKPEINASTKAGTNRRDLVRIFAPIPRYGFRICYGHSEPLEAINL
jgi:hypothetical protein